MTTSSGTPPDLNALVAFAQRQRQAGRLAEAAEAYRQILALRPDVAEVYNDLGIVLAIQGKLVEARDQFAQAIALKDSLVEAHFNLGNALVDLGRPGEAIDRFQRAIALRPSHAEARNNLALALGSQGRLTEAAAELKQAIALRPDFAAAFSNLGDVLMALGQLDEAVSQFQRAITLRPEYAEAHSNLGRALWMLSRVDDAQRHVQQALALRPHLPEAHTNLGIILADRGRFAEAVACFEQALTLRPNYPEAHNRLGRVFLSLEQLDRARQHFQQALALAPQYADAECSLATCYLLEGDFSRGWPHYEARLQLRPVRPDRDLPRYSGQPLAGRRLLLLAEQGLGDTIQFLRYARLLKARGAWVILACQRALARLLARHPDVDELFPLGSAGEMPSADFYLPLLSLPYALGTQLASVPAEIPYLSADPALVEDWRQQLAGIEGLKIGIAWQGSRTFIGDRDRSIPLSQFAPLAALSGVRLISLQKGFGAEQIAAVDFPVIDLSGRLDEAAGPFMDTAAVIRNLDLVVGPDTSIVHLAGALGAPVWVALQLLPDWRWLLKRDDSPWYPTMRLFRQTVAGAWTDVFHSIAAAVQARRT